MVLAPYWLGSPEDFDRLDKHGKPAALAWDLENARPGAWTIIQKLCSYSQYSQLPLLLLQENVADQRPKGGRVTEVAAQTRGKRNDSTRIESASGSHAARRNLDC